VLAAATMGPSPSRPGDTLTTKMQAAHPSVDIYGDEDQAAIVRRFCRGDRSAFGPLVRQWEHRLLTLAYRVVGNLHDAEEVRQIVLMKLAASAEKIAEPDRFAGWLRRSTVNEAIDWLRSRGSEIKRRKTFDDAVSSAAPSPAEQVSAAERSERLQEALGQLEPDDRAMVSLRFDEGMTIRQIAEVVNKPPMTVHSRIARAVGRLRPLLAGFEEVTR
jgi:RNA polymerase sigma-70 factor, ECF subfamily